MMLQGGGGALLAALPLCCSHPCNPGESEWVFVRRG